jgi:hypothetical protein
MPPHDVRRDGTPVDSYDAYSYCADWDAAARSQRIYAGCVCYSIKIPRDAWESSVNAATVGAVALNAAADRWIGEGFRVFVALSSSAMPELRPDALMALPYKTAALLPNTPSNESLPANADISIPLSDDPVAPRYIHVYLRLENYETYRGAWAEGSAIIDYMTILITYSREVIEDDDGGEDGDINLRLPLRAVGTTYLFMLDEDAHNLTDNWMRLDWGSKTLSAGLLLQDPKSVDALTLPPSIVIAGNRVQSRGYAFEAYNSFDDIAGRTLYLTPLASMVGTTPIVVVVHSGETMPPPSSASTWRGGAGTEIGRAAVSVSAGTPVEVPITKNPSGKIWVFVSFAPVPEADADLPSIGFPNSQGIDIVDAHIARRYIPRTRNRKGVLIYSASPDMAEALRILREDPFTADAHEQTPSLIHENGAADAAGRLMIPGSGNKWHDMSGGEIATPPPHLQSNYFYAASPQFGVFAISGSLGVVRSGPAIDLPAGLKDAQDINLYNSVFYNSQNRWIVSDSNQYKQTVYGSEMSSDPADRAILDRCGILSCTAEYFVGFDKDGYLFIANSAGNTAYSPDSAAVRSIPMANVLNVVIGDYYCAVIKIDGTVTVARFAPAWPVIDASGLSGVKGFALNRAAGQAVALLGDGTLSALGGAVIPPETLQHRITSVRSGIGASGRFIQLFFFDDAP